MQTLYNVWTQHMVLCIPGEPQADVLQFEALGIKLLDRFLWTKNEFQTFSHFYNLVDHLVIPDHRVDPGERWVTHS